MAFFCLPHPRMPTPHSTHRVIALTRVPLSPSLENQRELLCKVRTETRNLHLERREHVRHAVHGEVHGGMEPGQLGLPAEDTTGGWQQLLLISSISHAFYDHLGPPCTTLYHCTDHDAAKTIGMTIADKYRRRDVQGTVRDTNGHTVNLAVVGI